MALQGWSPWSIAVKIAMGFTPWRRWWKSGHFGERLSAALAPLGVGRCPWRCRQRPRWGVSAGAVAAPPRLGGAPEGRPGGSGALWIGGKSMEIRCNLVYNHPEVEHQHFNNFQKCRFGRMFRNIHSLSNSMTTSVKVVQEVCWILPWLFVRPRCLMQGWFIKLVLNWRCEIGYYFC